MVKVEITIAQKNNYFATGGGQLQKKLPKLKKTIILQLGGSVAKLNVQLTPLVAEKLFF
jgi:hypothetical protein